MPFVEYTWEGSRNHVLDEVGSRSAHEKGQILGVVRLTEKHWESLRRYKGIIQSSITARHAMQLFVELIDSIRCFCDY